MTRWMAGLESENTYNDKYRFSIYPSLSALFYPSFTLQKINILTQDTQQTHDLHHTTLDCIEIFGRLILNKKILELNCR